jgi:glucose/arabinose dehydrogenase
MKTNGVAKVAVAAGLFSSALAQSACPTVLVPTYTAPAVASGWQAQLVASGLKKPRSIQFDGAGALLVVDGGKGVLRYTFTDNGATCLQVDKQQLLINQTSVSYCLKLPSLDGVSSS